MDLAPRVHGETADTGMVLKCQAEQLTHSVFHAALCFSCFSVTLPSFLSALSAVGGSCTGASRQPAVSTDIHKTHSNTNTQTEEIFIHCHKVLKCFLSEHGVTVIRPNFVHSR